MSLINWIRDSRPPLAALALIFITIGGCHGRSRWQGGTNFTPMPQSTAMPHVKAVHEGSSDLTIMHHELPRRITLPENVISAINLETVPVEMAALPATIELTGAIAPDPDKSAQVVARVQGRIIEVNFKEGDRVKKHQLLVALNSPELAHARAALTASSARAKAARQNASRMASLVRKGLASAQQLATAEAEAESLEAEETAARQTLASFGPGAADFTADAARLDLRAPIDGYILMRDALIGRVVGPNQLLASIADFDRAYFLGRLFEKDLAHVSEGAEADIRLNAYPHKVFHGEVETISRDVDLSARTVVARIVIKNQGHDLKAGLFGIAKVVTRDPAIHSAQLVVPQSAVTHMAAHDAVFVQDKDGSFTMHQVTLGRSAEGKVEVLEGLTQGEHVVISGVFTLKSIVLKSALDKSP